MTLVEVLESIEEEGLTLFFANMEEANYGIESISGGLPACVVPPFVVTDRLVAGTIHSSAPLMLFFLNKIDSPTVEYKTREVEATIAAMRTKGRKFIAKLRGHESADLSEDFEDVAFTPVYMELDKGLFGVYAQFTHYFIEGVPNCNE
jgi:hypothetical protein